MWSGNEPTLKSRFQQVLVCNESLTFETFLCLLHICSTRSSTLRYRVIFNIFDVSGSGQIDKKEFKMVSKIFLNSASYTGTLDPKFTPLLDTMVESAVQIYDLNKDGKLNFEEWIVYAKQEPLLNDAVNQLIIPDLPALVSKIESFKSEQMIEEEYIAHL